MLILTKNRDGVRRRWHRLSHHEEEYDESKKNSHLKVDLLARLDGQKKAEEWNKEYEEAGSDEVYDVEKRSTSHHNRERHIGVGLYATCIELYMTLSVYPVYRPLLKHSKVFVPWEDQGRIWTS